MNTHNYISKRYFSGKKGHLGIRLFFKGMVFLLCFLVALIGVPLPMPIPNNAQKTLRMLRDALSPKETIAEQIKSVQRGTATIASDNVSAEATFTEVYMPKSFSVTAGALPSNKAEQDLVAARHLDPETLMVYKGSAKAGVGDIAWQMVEFDQNLSVQKGAASLGSGIASKTIFLITPVDDGKSFPLATALASGQAVAEESGAVSIKLSDLNGGQWESITITRTNSADSCMAEWQVIELETANVYGGGGSYGTGEFTMGSGTGEMTRVVTTDFPAAVTTSKSFLVLSSYGSSGATLTQFFVRGVVTNGSTLTFTRQSTTNAANINWYLVELVDASVSVQRDVDTLSGTSVDIGVPTAVVDSESFTLISSSTTTATAGGAYVMHDLATSGGSTTLTLSANASSSSTVAWQVVSFPSMTLTAPNGGDVWTVGESVSIEWLYSDTMKTGGTGTGTSHVLDIELGDSGGYFTTKIDTGVDAIDGAYPWTVLAALGSDDTIGETMKIRITDTDADPDFSDESNVVFIIKGKITVDQPPDTWKIGETTNSITWDYDGNLENLSTTTVTIKIDTENGDYDHTLTTDTEVDAVTGPGSGSYPWTIPASLDSVLSPGTYTNLIGTDRKVKVIFNRDPDSPKTTVEDESNGFTLSGDISNVAYTPSGDVNLGESKTITWDKDGYFGDGIDWGTVDIWYSAESGGAGTYATNPPIKMNQDAGTDAAGGSYGWTVPYDLTEPTGEDQGMIKVEQSSDSNVYDESSLFDVSKGTITLDTPNGTESWDVGTTQHIIWERTDNLAGSNVQLQISRDNGEEWDPIEIVSANLNYDTTYSGKSYYAWTPVEAPVTTQALVWIDSMQYPGVVEAESAAVFTLNADITVTAPAADVTWNLGEGNTITWTYEGETTYLGDVYIKLSRDDGVGWEFLNGGVPVAIGTTGTGSWLWDPVTGPMTTEGRIKIESTSIQDTADVYLSGESPANPDLFTLNADITITAPVADATWNLGEGNTITWTYEGGSTYLGDVYIKLSRDDGEGWEFLNGGVPVTIGTTGAGSWLWDPVTGPMTTEGRIQIQSTSVQDMASTYLSDESPGDPDLFNLNADITVTAPILTDIWKQGESNTITWTYDGDATYLGNVYIKLSRNAGGGWEFLNDATPVSIGTAGAGSWLWDPVEGPSTVQGRIKIESTSIQDMASAYLFGQSPLPDDIFIVRQVINITYPTTEGLIWEALTPETITWDLTETLPSGNKVDIYYKKGTGGSWNQITDPSGVDAGTVVAGGSWEWTSVVADLHDEVYIKVEDHDGQVINDVSTYVKIKGWLDVYQPDGVNPIDSSGSCWIRWNDKGGVTGDFTMKYSKDDGGDGFSVTIADTTVGGSYPDFTIVSGEYEWTTPDIDNLDENDSMIRIVKDTDADTKGDSASFTMIGSITNVQIDGSGGGGTYTFGDAFTISWTAYPDGASELGTVSLRYDTNSGASYPVENEFHTTDASDGSYEWTMNDDNCLGDSIRFQVRLVVDSTDLVRNNTSPNTKIYGGISMVQPTENAQDSPLTWECGGTDPTIKWDYTGSMTTVNLYYSKDGTQGAATNEIATGISAPLKQYDWTIPVDDSVFKAADNGKNDDIIIKVVNADFPDDVKAFSAQPVTIKSKLINLSPSGNTIYVGTVNQPITWTTKGEVPTVNIKYDTANGTGGWGGTVVDGISNVGTYTEWAKVDCPLTTPDVGGSGSPSQIVFKVESAHHASDINMVGSEVTVKGMLEITSPDATNVDASSVIADDTFTITWLVNNGKGKSGNFDLGDLKLWYAEDGSTFTTLVSDTITSSGDSFFAWPTPDPTTLPVEGCALLIEDQDETTEVNDQSDGFEIKGALYKTTVGDLELIEPNGGETYEVEIDDMDIQWKYKGNIGTCELKWGQAGSFDNTLDSNVDHDLAESGGICMYTYTSPWEDGPSVAGTDYKFKIVSATSGEETYVYANSKNYFAMKGSVTLTAPGMDSGNVEEWYVDSAQTISWDITGNVPSAEIWLDVDGDEDYDDYQIATAGATTPFSWDIPSLTYQQKRDITSDTCRVKIQFDETTYSESTNEFFIRPKFDDTNSLTEITAGTSWTVAEASDQFSWEFDGKIDNVKLKFSDDGTNWYDDSPEIIIAAGAGSGDYIWSSIVEDNIVSHNSSAIKLVKVTKPDTTWIEDTNVEVASTLFTVKGKINVTSPTTNQSYNVQDTGQINWNVQGDVGTVCIMYNINSGGSFPDGSWLTFPGATGIAPDYCTNDPGTAYTFTTPETTASEVKIRVAEESYELIVYGPTMPIGDAPTHQFLGNIIFDKPNVPTGYYSTRDLTGADAIQMGPNDEHQLDWSLVGTFTEGVNVEYKIGTTGQWTNSGTGFISGSPVNTDTNTHYNPDDSHITLSNGSNKIYFRVEDAGLPDDVYEETPENPSDEGNEVKGYLELVAPDPTTYHLYTVNQAQKVPLTWKKYGNIGTLKIQIWADGAWKDNQVVTTGLDDSYASGTSGETPVEYQDGWLVPDIIANDCKIRLMTNDTDKPTLTSQSTTAFEIKGGIISVTDPLTGGEALWYTGEDHIITWDALGTMSAVNIQLVISSGEGQGTYDLATNYSGPPALIDGINNFTWSGTDTDMEQRNNDCKIVVTSVQNQNATNETGTFTLKPEIVVDTPSSAWIAESSSNTITWDPIAAPTDVIDIILIDGDAGFSDLPLTPGAGIAKNSSPYESTVQLPSVLTNNAKIRIQDHSATSLVYGETDTSFSIIGDFTIDAISVSPDTWKVGDTGKQITWSHKGDMGSDVRIYVDYNYPAGWETQPLATNLPCGQHYWNWTPDIPDKVSNDIYIMMTDGDKDTTNTAIEYGPFSIIGGFAIQSPLDATGHVHQINNNNNPTPPSELTIEWISTGIDTTEVKLEYTLNDSDWVDIITNKANNGNGVAVNQYKWGVSSPGPLLMDAATLSARIRITANNPVHADTETE
ncbi:hypothetical protein ACFL28_01770, partial [Candidatus Omnitrophota bacterium]